MNVHLTEEGVTYGKNLSARLDMLWKNEDWQRTLAYDSEYPEEENHGIFGYEPCEAVFSFSDELAAPCSVVIETWDRSSSYTVTQMDMTLPFVLELPGYPAHYTVYASFYGQDGVIYQAWYDSRYILYNYGGR